MSKIAPIKFRMSRVYLDKGGYNRGEYFGVGAPLYWYEDVEQTIQGTVCGSSREAAKAKVRKLFKSAIFFI